MLRFKLIQKSLDKTRIFSNLKRGWAMENGLIEWGNQIKKLVDPLIHISSHFPFLFKNYFKLEMVFLCQNCSDLLWEKKCSSNREKLLKFEAEGWKFVPEIFAITRTIYLNSERSEPFLVLIRILFELVPVGFSLKFKLEKKILGFRNIQEKLENYISWNTHQT